MQHCKYCKVDVAGDKACCPLCGGVLSGHADVDSEVFPPSQVGRRVSVLILRLLALLGISASIVCVIINLVIPAKVFWALFVVAGSVSTWLAVYVGLRYRRDVIQNVTWQAFLISAITVLFDVFTGWSRWSIDFVLPSLCLVGIVSIIVLSLTLRISISAAAPRVLLLCLLGIACGVMALLGLLRHVVLALVSMGICVAVLAFMIIFQWQTIQAELVKRFHL